VGCIYACIHKTFYLFAAVEFFPRPVHNLVDFCCFAFATQLDITFFCCCLFAQINDASITLLFVCAGVYLC